MIKLISVIIHVSIIPMLHLVYIFISFGSIQSVAEVEKTFYISSEL